MKQSIHLGTFAVLARMREVGAEMSGLLGCIEDIRAMNRADPYSPHVEERAVHERYFHQEYSRNLGYYFGLLESTVVYESPGMLAKWIQHCAPYNPKRRY